jgi:rod shape-determining protein MreC
MSNGTLIIVIAIAVVAIGIFGFFVPYIHTVAGDVAFSIRATGAVIAGAPTLYREFINATLENQNLRAQLYVREHIEQENKALRTALGMQERTGRAYLPASVLISEATMLSNELVIDKGRRDGVETGMPVLWGTETFIGKIKSVSETYGVIETLLSPSVKLPVRVGADSVPALLDGGTDPVLSFMHTDGALAVGDHVVTAPGLERIPDNLYIGDVRTITSNESGVFQGGLVKMPYLIHGIFEVFVLK